MANSDSSFLMILNLFDPIESIPLYFHFGVSFQPPYEVDLQNNVRFRFSTPTNIRLIYDAFQSKYLNFTTILEVHFNPHNYGVDVKNNVRFGFGIPKRNKIDIRHIPIKQFAPYPHFGLPLQPPHEADLKNNIRFESVSYTHLTLPTIYSV